MTNFFNSGLYERSFFTKHKIYFYEDQEAYQETEYNYELLMEEYKMDLDLEYKDEDDLQEQVDQLFWENLGYWPVYLEPLIFNEEIALECSLTPFTYKGVNMLALSGCGMDLSPRLDAYQALVDNTIDNNSSLFSQELHFKYVVGEHITKKVLQAISM